VGQRAPECRLTQHAALLDLAARGEAAHEDRLQHGLLVLLGELPCELDPLPGALLGLVEVPQAHGDPAQSDQGLRQAVEGSRCPCRRHHANGELAGTAQVSEIDAGQARPGREPENACGGTGSERFDEQLAHGVVVPASPGRGLEKGPEELLVGGTRRRQARDELTGLGEGSLRPAGGERRDDRLSLEVERAGRILAGDSASGGAQQVVCRSRGPPHELQRALHGGDRGLIRDRSGARERPLGRP